MNLRKSLMSTLAALCIGITPSCIERARDYPPVFAGSNGGFDLDREKREFIINVQDKRGQNPGVKRVTVYDVFDGKFRSYVMVPNRRTDIINMRVKIPIDESTNPHHTYFAVAEDIGGNTTFCPKIRSMCLSADHDQEHK